MLCRLIAPFAGMLMLAGGLPHAVADTIDFNRDVRPILSENCFRCHGPDEKQRQAGLRLDLRDQAVAKKAILPGKADDSEAIHRVLSTDDSDRMPPKEMNKHLTPVQVEVLKRWINGGANYAAHWAFIKPVRPAVPGVRNKSWPRMEIDAFILARLEKEGLKPSPEASRETLIRRVALDLTGLPPTPQEVDAFVADTSPRRL